MEEIEQQVEFLSTKVDRALGAISATWSALSTGATWQRIHGAILVPDSVGNGVITDGAITETKIDSDAVSTPKLQANAVTAAKLEANLVLSTNIIGGTFSDPNIFGVVLGTQGLKLFDGGGVQRGWMKTDGSGWLGSSTAFSWTTAGAVTATGITVATAGGVGARVTLDSTGLKMYNASNQLNWELVGGTGMRWYNATGTSQRGELNSNGTGWVGVSSSQGMSWDNGGNLTLTSATFRSGATTAKVQVDASGLHVYNASGVKTGYFSPSGDGFMGSTGGTSGTAAISWGTTGTATINATNVNTGSLNGNLLSAGSVLDSAVGSLSANKITAGSGIINALTIANTLTLGSGGKIQDADGSTWDQTGIILKSSGSFGDAIRWRNNVTDIGSIYASSTNFEIAGSAGFGFLRFQSGNFYLTSAVGPSIAGSSSGLLGYGTFYPGYGTGSSQATYGISHRNTAPVGIAIGGNLTVGSNVYPSGSTTQYIAANGTYLTVNGPINFGNTTTYGSAGVLQGYIGVYVNGSGIVKIPYYASV